MAIQVINGKEAQDIMLSHISEKYIPLKLRELTTSLKITYDGDNPAKIEIVAYIPKCEVNIEAQEDAS